MKDAGSNKIHSFPSCPLRGHGIGQLTRNWSGGQVQ